jgi:hypothetical protein
MRRERRQARGAHLVGRNLLGRTGFFAQRRNRTDEMTDAKYDVLGIGKNAIFDALAQADEAFARHGMTKGGMALIDEARAAATKDSGPAR